MLDNPAAKRYKYSAPTTVESSNNSMSSSSASPPLSPSPNTVHPLGSNSNKLNKIPDFPNPYMNCNPYYSYNSTPTSFNSQAPQMGYNYENYLLQQQSHFNQYAAQQQWSEAFVNPYQQVSKSTDASSNESNCNKENSLQQNESLPLKKRRQIPPECRDKSYFEKRKKNNESAKRSRDQRKRKEDRIVMRNVILEQENLQLKTQVALYEAEIEKLRCIAYGMQQNGATH
jgi:hypothetical protein